MRKRHELSAIANNIETGFIADRYLMGLTLHGPKDLASKEPSIAKAGTLILEHFMQLEDKSSGKLLSFAADERLLPGRPDLDWRTVMKRCYRVPSDWTMGKLIQSLYETANKILEGKDITQIEAKRLKNFFDLLGEITLVQSDELQSHERTEKVEKEWRPLEQISLVPSK